MSLDRFNNKYRVPSARALWHDYNAGMYFVTICTKDKVHYFGEIGCGNNGEGQMNLSIIGEYVTKCISEIPQHNPYAAVPLFVVMPNHIHMVVEIVVDPCRDVPWRVSDDMNNDNKGNVPWRVSTDGKNKCMQNIANHQGKPSTVIGGFKQSVTRFANENHLPFAWQPRFYDRIIRNTDELNRIANYIEKNVVQWDCDRYNNKPM